MSYEDDLVERADTDAQSRRNESPEMNREFAIAPHMLVEALAVGVLRSDRYYLDYTVPRNFEAVLNRFHFRVLEAIGPLDRYGVAHLTLNQCWGLLSKLPALDPDYLAWSEVQDEPPGNHDGPISKSRGWIDLVAVTQNAIVHLKEILKEYAR